MKKQKKRNSSNFQTNREKINKRAKLQSIGHNLKNKVNNLLNEIEANEKIDNIMLNQQINPNPNNVDLPIIIPKINPNLEKENLEKEKNSINNTKENPNNKNNKRNSLNLQDIEKNSKKLKKKIKKLQKGSFMTGVGLTKIKKEPVEIDSKSKDEMMNKINTQINEILKNIDDEDDSTKVNKYINHLKNSSDFKNIIEEIDSYTNEIHEEFDEIKYLIKFADNTHKLIDRHKNVMTNIFRGAGLRPSKRIEEEEKLNNEKGKTKKFKSVGKFNKKDNLINYGNIDEEIDDQPYYKNGYYYRNAREDDINFGEVFDKLKAINKVKDNLSNIQDDFLGYHQNLRTKMRRINGGK